MGKRPWGVARCVDTRGTGEGAPEATMNFAWFSATSRFAAVALASAAFGAVMWSGCGPGSGSGYSCNDTGCFQCDGYGCSAVAPPAAVSCSSDKDCASG